MIRLARLQVVLYLDFDGVLHDEDVWWHYKYGVYMKTQGRKLFEWLHILEELLAPYPDVKIVLSTTWVRKRSFNYARRQLSPALRKRVIGATYHSREMSEDEFRHQTRVAQITADAARRQPFAWFALEDLGDDAGDWPEHLKEKLVLTDGRLGLSELAVQAQVRALLARLTRAATAALAEA